MQRWGGFQRLAPIRDMAQTVRRLRLDLDARDARALRAGLQEALAADLLHPDHTSAARDVLARLVLPAWPAQHQWRKLNHRRRETLPVPPGRPATAIPTVIS